MPAIAGAQPPVHPVVPRLAVGMGQLFKRTVAGDTQLLDRTGCTLAGGGSIDPFFAGSVGRGGSIR